MAKLNDLTGQRFGRLVAVERGADAIYSKQSCVRWICNCDCGERPLVHANSLRSGATQSCGCYDREVAAARQFKHGKAHNCPEYEIWATMKQRCLNPNSQMFKYYGARVFSDMGSRPDGTTLDRLDNDLGYEPGNCEWRTPLQQGRNSRKNTIITIDGKSHCVSEWSEISGTKRPTISSRLSKGWPEDQAVFHPVMNLRRKTYA